MYVIQKFSCHTPKLWSKNWSTKQIVLDLSYEPSDAPWSEIILNWATSKNEFIELQKSSKNCQNVTRPLTFVDSLIDAQFPSIPVLLLELERLYESCITLLAGANHLSRCWTPGRAAKIQFRPHFYVCDPKIVVSYTKTLEQKLYAKTNVPGHLVWTIRF